MYKMILILAASAAALAFAADPTGFHIWKAGELKGYEKSLAPKMDSANKVATQQLASYGNHSAMVAHREADGQAELHEKNNDLFVCSTGEATLVVGGKMPGAKTTAPGEMRSATIEGGSKQKLGPGDIVHIPAGVPHQLMVEKGKQFTYFTMKVATK